MLGESMKKLNRKGYLTIEVILASAITFVIAFFLIEITMKIVSTTDDAYADTIIMTDRALVIKNIKENIEKDICEFDGITDVTCNSNNKECVISFNRTAGPREARVIEIVGKEIKYGDGEQDTDRTYFYTKELNKRLSDITITSENNGDYYLFKITGENIFTDKNYDINIIVYNDKTC